MAGLSMGAYSVYSGIVEARKKKECEEFGIDYIPPPSVLEWVLTGVYKAFCSVNREEYTETDIDMSAEAKKIREDEEAAVVAKLQDAETLAKVPPSACAAPSPLAR